MTHNHEGSPPYLTKKEKEAIEEQAAETLKIYEDSGRSLTEAIDIEFIAEELFGIPIEEEELDPDIDAFINPNHKRLKIIMNKKGRSKERKRFSPVHELGHIQLGHETQTVSQAILFMKADKEKYSREQVKKEQEANAYAACLLMPRKSIEDIWQQVRGSLTPIIIWRNQLICQNTINEYKQYLKIKGVITKQFCVSATASIIRLRELGLFRVAKEQEEHLFRLLG